MILTRLSIIFIDNRVASEEIIWDAVTDVPTRGYLNPTIRYVYCHYPDLAKGTVRIRHISGFTLAG